jgi:hypothetical protein
MKYHIILDKQGNYRQLSKRAYPYARAIKRARKLAADMFPSNELTNTSTGCRVKEYTEVYVIESAYANDDAQHPF